MNSGKMERLAALGCACAALSVGLNLLLAGRGGLRVLPALTPFYAFALVVSIVAYARLRLARLADEERKEEELARREAAGAALFQRAEGEEEPFTVARSRRQFERFVVPLAAPLLALLQALAVWRVWRGLQAPAPEPGALLASAALLAGQAFVLFLAGRILLGFYRAPGGRLLRAPGVYLGLGALLALLAAAAAIAAHAGIAFADSIAVWIVLVLFSLLAAENLLSAIAGLYRPNADGAESSSPYESRLGALLTDPAAWVHNVAQAFDYQFGFNVSQTWFYRFVANALLPLFIFQALSLYLLSCLVFLGPDEEGIRERFGRPLDPPARGRLQSGFHLKAPWPWETVRRESTRRIRRLDVGYSLPLEESPRVMLWTVPHHAAKDIILTAYRDAEEEPADEGDAVPVNLLSVHLPIQYYITNLYQYAYSYADADQVLEHIAYRNLTRTALHRGLFDMVGEGQLEAARLLHTLIQEEADRHGLGLRIAFVGLQGVHPPVAVADAFESVIGALEEKESAILAAHAYTNRVLPLARAAAQAEEAAAVAYAVGRREGASSEAYRFEQRRESYRVQPRVYLNDLYLRSLRDALRDSRRYVVAAWSDHEVLQFDFQEKLQPDLFDLSPMIPQGNAP